MQACRKRVGCITLLAWSQGRLWEVAVQNLEFAAIIVQVQETSETVAPHAVMAQG